MVRHPLLLCGRRSSIGRTPSIEPCDPGIESHLRLDLYQGFPITMHCVKGAPVCDVSSLFFIYGQKLELIKALKVLNEGFTIGLHINWLELMFRFE